MSSKFIKETKLKLLILLYEKYVECAYSDTILSELYTDGYDKDSKILNK